ncbi:MAG: hypothetical protein LQ338_006076, partial [Usnochroma carphineum]
TYLLIPFIFPPSSPASNLAPNVTLITVFVLSASLSAAPTSLPPPAPPQPALKTGSTTLPASSKTSSMLLFSGRGLRTHISAAQPAIGYQDV